jgi:hypothetical protein
MENAGELGAALKSHSQEPLYLRLLPSRRCRFGSRIYLVPNDTYGGSRKRRATGQERLQASGLYC